MRSDLNRSGECSEAVEEEKMSFSMDVGGGKKLRLIDITTEDDYLIASPLFDSLEDLRLSVTLDSRNTASEHKLLTSDSMDPGRPSYLRKSLAWDTAFFTNAGVLDPDELLLMNKGVKYRPPLGAQPWGHASGYFEGDPFADVRAPIQRSGKMSNGLNTSRATAPGQAGLTKKKGGIHPQKSRCGEDVRLPLKPPMGASGQLRSCSTGKHEPALTGKRHVLNTTGNNPAGKGPVCNMVSKKVSSIANKNLSLSCCSYDSRRKTVSPDIPPNHLKRKIECRKSNSAYTSTAHLTNMARSKLQDKLNRSTMSLSTHSSRQSTTSSTDSSFIPFKRNHPIDAATAKLKCLRNGTSRTSQSQSHALYQSFNEESKPRPRFLLNTASNVEASPSDAKSAEGSKRSGLRMPSPKIGFFDEVGGEKVRGNLHSPLEIRNASTARTGARARTPPAILTSLKHHVSTDSETRGNPRLGSRHARSCEKLKRGSPVGSEVIRSLPDKAPSRYNDKPSRTGGGNWFKAKKIREADPGKTTRSPSLRAAETRTNSTPGDKLKSRENKGKKAKDSDINRSKESELRNSMDNDAQVDELSKFMKVIDLSKDVVMKGYNNSSSSVSSPLPFTEEIKFSARTPLIEKTSISNRTAIHKTAKDSRTAKPEVDEHQPFCPLEEDNKENI